MNKTLSSFFLAIFFAASCIHNCQASDNSFAVSGTLQLTKKKGSSPENNRSSSSFLLGTTFIATTVGICLYGLYRYLDIHTPKQDKEDKEKILEKVKQTTQLLTTVSQNNANDLHKNLTIIASKAQLIEESAKAVNGKVDQYFDTLIDQYQETHVQQISALNNVQYMLDTIVLNEQEKLLKGQKNLKNMNENLDELFEGMLKMAEKKQQEKK